MLRVWSLCWGDKYSDYHVQRLQRTVKENLTVEHEFVCITDRAIEGVICIPPAVDWPGWWGKLAVFFDDAYETNLFLDLDVVITGSLDPIVESLGSHDLAMPLNWAASGHGGCQSSVMVWRPCWTNRQIFNSFKREWAHWPPINKPGVFWGDQEFITHLRDHHRILVHPIPEQYIKSYKYHCQNGLPDDCRVVVFHGDPKPESVRTPWFQW